MTPAHDWIRLAVLAIPLGLILLLLAETLWETMYAHGEWLVCPAILSLAGGAGLIGGAIGYLSVRGFLAAAALIWPGPV